MNLRLILMLLLVVMACIQLSSAATQANNDTFNASTHISVRLNLTANDVGTDITVGSIGQPNHGAVTNNYDGTVNYRSDVGYIGTDSFSYELTVAGSKEFEGHYYEYVASSNINSLHVCTAFPMP